MRDRRVRELEAMVQQSDRGRNRSRSPRRWQFERLGIQTLRADDVLYSQTSMSDRFSDGSLLSTLVRDLLSGNADLFRDERLCLTVADWPGRGLVSIDNRRLWCIKQYQEHERQEGGSDVYLRAVVFRLPQEFAQMTQVRDF